MSNSILEIEDSPFLLCVGTNMTECHPVIAVRVKRAVRKGAKLIVIDPRRIGLVDHADRFLRLNLGSDVALFNAMANVIIQEGLADREYVEKRTTDYELFAKHVKKFTPEWAEKITGVPAADIRGAAIDFAKAERAGIYYTLGITEHICGVGNVQSLCNLALLTGNLGKRSAGVNPLRGQNNIQGAGDCGALPNNYPGFQKVEDPSCKAKFEKIWGVPMDPDNGITKIKALDYAVEGKIRAMWIVGENTLVTDPDMAHTRRAFNALDFLVVQDIFLTDTAKMADVVFPAAAFAETDGFFANTERRVQRIRQVVPPPGEAKPDWWIVSQVGRRMTDRVNMTYENPGEVFDELAEVSPFYHGMSYDRIDGEGLQWPCPDSDHPGTGYLHVDRFENGRGIFQKIEYVPPAEIPDEKYPFFLTTGRRLATYHTNTQTGQSKRLRYLVPNEWLEVHPRDARKLKVADGDWVEVSSRRGEVVTRVKVTRQSPPGTTFMSFAFPEETLTNKITNPETDPNTETPEFKIAAVGIRKIRPPKGKH